MNLVGFVGMNTMPDAAPERDFSRLAYLRGAAASALCAYLLLALVYPLVLFARNPFEHGTALELLGNAVQPVNLFTGAVFFSAAASVGLVFLVWRKRDHTTFGAAGKAGAMTAATVIGVICLLGLGPSLVDTLTHRPQDLLTPDFWRGVPGLIWISLVVISSGAISGLAFRAAAGAPTAQRTPDPA